MADLYLFILDGPIFLVGEIKMEAVMITLENASVIRNWREFRIGVGLVTSGKISAFVNAESCPDPSFPKEREVVRFKLPADWETA